MTINSISLQNLNQFWITTDQPWRFLCTFVTLFAILCYFLYTKFKKGGTSRFPPGPRGLPLVGSLPFLDPELHVYFAGLAREYGPIVKIRLGTKLGILVTSASAAREVLKDNDVTFANRDVPAVGRITSYGGNDIVWNPYGPEWRMLRKVCVQKCLSVTSLDSVYTLRRREVRETVRYIHSQAGSVVNLGEQMFLTILNVITNTLWGGSVDGKERDGLGAEFRTMMANMTELLGKPNVSDFFPGLAWFDLQGFEKRMKGLIKELDQIFDRIIEKRLKIEGDGNGRNSDFLEFLLKLKNEKDAKTPFTMIHLKSLLMDMVIGGSDTSSNLIEFCMAEVIKKQDVMRKAQEELEVVVGKDNIVEESHIHKLPYLRAIVKESLRLHPTLPLLVPHCPSETCTVGGYTIPKGSRVFVNVWAIHRDPLVWEDPLEFNPERFMNDRWDFSGTDFSYLPFGSGRRICAGIAMADRMVMYSLATLLHSFDWKLPQGQKVVDLTEKFGIVLKLKTSLSVIPIPRLSDSTLYM